MKNTKIGVIGLGKLGTPLLACLAQHYNVCGFDSDEKVLDNINTSKIFNYEPGVNELLGKFKKKIYTLNSLEKLVQSCSIVFICLPTPSKVDGSFDCSHIESTCKAISKFRDLRSELLIVIVSTLMPNQMENKIIPLFKKIKNIKICYNPFFIALGNVIQNITYPDLILIGESTPQDSQKLRNIYSKLCKNNPMMFNTSYLNAEIAKIALNSFITMKISFANNIARICEKSKGADANVVLKVIGSDSRIGSKYLKGSIGYGGPCFPRDNLALSNFMEQLSIDNHIPKIIHDFNEEQIQYFHKVIKMKSKKCKSIGILGVTYKPNTHSTDNSQIWEIAKMLSKLKKIFFYDPKAILDSHTGITRENSVSKLIDKSDMLVIGTPWDNFTNLEKKINNSDIKFIVDLWGIINKKLIKPSIQIIVSGEHFK